MIDVSILMVSYNTSELTCAAIQSVYDQTRDVSFELIVVDNNSSDGSADVIAKRFPELNLIRLESNIGFAAANNMASEYATGKYILLLNPDTVVLDSAIDKLVSFANKNPEYGIYGGSSFFPDGSRNTTSGWMKPTPWSILSVALGLSKLFDSNKFLNSESLNWFDWNSTLIVDIVTGCFLLIKKKNWNLLGGFDSRFFMYAEDADLCLRAKKNGIDSVIYPDAYILHYGGASETKRAEKMIRLFKAKSQLFRIHYSYIYASTCISMLFVWCILRLFIFSFLSLIDLKYRYKRAEWKKICQRYREWVL